MPFKEPKIEKVFYSIGEVSEMFDLPTSTLRYWEQEFTMLNPKRNSKGTRYYTKKDIDQIKLIHQLVKERGLTIKGAKQKIKHHREDLDQTQEVVNKLKVIRERLIRMREEL